MDHRLDVEDEDGLHMEGSDRGVHLGNDIGTENVILVGRRRRRGGGGITAQVGRARPPVERGLPQWQDDPPRPSVG
jgi:hypothetical protein